MPGWTPRMPALSIRAKCRVAIARMSLHKETPAQQSIIRCARYGCGATLEVSARLLSARLLNA
jgi:hypothetical protein